MPHSEYPSASDLDAFFVSTGLIASSSDTPYASIDRGSKCAAASADFERRTRRTMIAQSSTRLFDVPWDRLGVLDVADDLLSADTVMVDGATLVEGLQYWLLPYDAVQKGRPYTHIEMAFIPTPGPLSSYRRTVSVTGSWGYGTEIPDEVWGSVLAWAAALCAPEIALNISKGLALWHEGDEEERYGGLGVAGPLAREAAEWTEMYQSTVRSWTRYMSWS
jgi:hypothetical protein